MGRKRKTIEQFIEQAIAVHGNRYDYSIIQYTHSITPLNIRCRVHGGFSQLPSNHLKGHGCPVCSANSQCKTTKQFIEQSFSVHGDRYDYSEVVYVNDKTLVIVGCLIHGRFHVTPNKHISAGTGCPKCVGKYKTTEQFIQQAIEAHDSRYDYSKAVYVNDKTKIEIVCLLHGSFFQIPSNHTSLHQGCPTCKHEAAKNNLGIFNRGFFASHPELKTAPAIFYAVECCDVQNTSFIKIGITTTSVKKRLYGIPYKYNVVKEQHITLEQAVELEYQLKNEFSRYRYLPMKKFPGHTECFLPEIVSML